MNYPNAIGDIQYHPYLLGKWKFPYTIRLRRVAAGYWMASYASSKGHVSVQEIEVWLGVMGEYATPEMALSFAEAAIEMKARP